MTDKPKSSRWLKIALGVSLCLNLLVAGAIGGAFFKGSGGKFEGARAIAQDPLRAVFGALPRETRHDLMRQMRQTGRDHPQNRSAWVSDFTTLLRAETLDKNALEALFKRRTERLELMTSTGRSLLIENITAMTPDERNAMADKAEKRWKRNKRWHGKDKK